MFYVDVFSVPVHILQTQWDVTLHKVLQYALKRKICPVKCHEGKDSSMGLAANPVPIVEEVRCRKSCA